MIFVNFV